MNDMFIKSTTKNKFHEKSCMISINLCLTQIYGEVYGTCIRWACISE